MKLIKSIAVVIAVIITFIGCYYIWFHLGGHSVEEKEISISFVPKDYSSLISKNQTQLHELKHLLEKLEEQQKIRAKQNKKQSWHNEKYLTISTLNAFYGSLFTAFAVLTAILGLSIWKTKTKLDEKLEKLKIIEKKVTFLYKKKELAEWSKAIFDNEENDISSSSELKLTSDDKKKLNEVKDYITNEITDDSWLQIIIAKELFKTHPEKALRLLRYIEKRDLFDEKSTIEAVLYHLMGLFNKEIFDKFKDKRPREKLNKYLEDSIEYYKKALNCSENRNETHGNLAIVRIEQYVFNTSRDSLLLDEAMEHLEKVIGLKKATYNTYYDYARAQYLKGNKAAVENLLSKAVERINYIGEKDYFIDYLEKDEQLKMMNDWEDLKLRIKDKIRQINYLRK